MNAAEPAFGKLRPNPDWASLPLFARSKWERVRFGDVVRQMKEEVDPASGEVERYVAGEHMDTENVHIRAWGNVGDGYLGPAFIRRFRKGQVLYGSRRTYLKKVAVAEWDGVTANTTFVLEAVEGKLLQELLPWLMLSDRFTKHSVQESKGSTNPYINFPDIAKFEFDLPPLSQQRGIAEILWAADDALEASRGTLANLEQFRVAKLFQRYRRGIGHTAFVDSPLGRRPRTWEVTPLGRHYEIQLGKMMSPKAITGKSQRPYLRNANVQWNRFDLTDVTTMSFSEREAQKFELRPGDILACEGRHVGKSAMWRNEIPGACYQKALHRIRALDDQQVPEFLLFQLEHHSRSGIFADQTGETTIPHLPAERLREIPFGFPPRDEQRAIADEMETLVASAKVMQNHVKTSERVLSELAESVVTPS